MIEIDGSVHGEQDEYDQERENSLMELGYQVIRFENMDVINKIEMVLAKIFEACVVRNPNSGTRS